MYLETFMRMSDEAIIHIWTGKKRSDWDNWYGAVFDQLDQLDDKNKVYSFLNKAMRIRNSFVTIGCICGYETPIGTNRELLRNHHYDGHECIHKTVIPTMPGMVD